MQHSNSQDLVESFAVLN